MYDIIIQTQPSLHGVKLSAIMPFLVIIAKQNGLKLSKLSDFKRAVRLYTYFINN